MTRAFHGVPVPVVMAVLVALFTAACDFDDMPINPLVRDALTHSGGVARFLAADRTDQLGGGNVVLGGAGPIGRGRVAVSLKARRAGRDLPNLNGLVIRGGEQSPAPLPVDRTGSSTAISVNGAIGVTSGIPVGRTRILGIDLLGGWSVLPGIGRDPLGTTIDRESVFSFGARIGLLGETPSLPAVSVTAMGYAVPEFGFRRSGVPTENGGTATLGMSTRGVSVSSVRAAASKEFGRLGVTVGLGFDEMTGRADLTASVDGESGERSISLDNNRNNSFVGASYRLGAVTLGFEAGRLSNRNGSDFSEPGISRSKGYLAVGARIGP